MVRNNYVNNLGINLFNHFSMAIQSLPPLDHNKKSTHPDLMLQALFLTPSFRGCASKLFVFFWHLELAGTSISSMP